MGAIKFFSSSSHDNDGWIVHFSSSSHDDKKYSVVEVQKLINEGNPNPKNWKIRKSKAIGKFLVIKIHYPDCKNYEGKKILVFKNCSLNELYIQGSIDPHFSNNDAYHNPIARFVPTNEGWKMAIQFCKVLNKKK